MGLTSTSAWSVLQGHHATIKNVHMRDLFAQDADRADRFSLSVASLFLDYSKNLITKDTVKHLFALARQSNVEGWREHLFNGEKINHTEDRAVLHTALRLPENHPDIRPEVVQLRRRMQHFVAAIHAGNWKGYSSKRITHIINIGIGGSDLGPLLLNDALRPYTVYGMQVDFISNIDAYPLLRLLNNSDPETTLFIIASKSFITLETRTNAETARAWFLQKGGGVDDIKHHFIAVTNNVSAAVDFGIALENIFPMWDWVGGRYSVWSAIGLPLAISVGMEEFNKLLNGAWQMDQHFLQAPLEKNMPVVLALLGIWYINFFKATTLAVVPYDQRLQYLPDYLQQLDMESNGKHVNRKGQRVDYATGPIIWGTVGTNAQHAYFQSLHQGTCFVPVDFILTAYHPFSEHTHHESLLANCLAQSEALMQGKTSDELEHEIKSMSAEQRTRMAPYIAFEGNRPSNTLLLDELNPETLGMLIALYEHKVFVQGIIWEINSFDQWGVEYGKRLAERVAISLREQSAVALKEVKTSHIKEYQLSASSQGLIKQLKHIAIQKVKEKNEAERFS